MFETRVYGVARPQGSKKAYSRGGNIVLVEASKDLKPWRELVAATIKADVDSWQLADGPVAVSLKFFLPKPPSVKREHLTVPPDIDKLVRGVLDAITQSGVIWRDDSQVIYLTATKSYSPEPHTVIQVSRV